MRYAGESCNLYRVVPAGLGRPFLVFDACVGAYTMRRIAFAILPGGTLDRAADVITVREIHGDWRGGAITATFEDADGDGIEEFAEGHREWITNEEGELIDNWAIRTVYHAWDGRRFFPRFVQLFACEEQGALERIDR